MLMTLGFWSDAPDDGFPTPHDLVDDAMGEAEARGMADVLDRGIVAGVAMGSAVCRICGARIGNRQLSDRVFLWPEGLSHYVLLHRVRLPEEFVRHVQESMSELELAESDDAWWKTSTRARRGTGEDTSVPGPLPEEIARRRTAL